MPIHTSLYAVRLFRLEHSLLDQSLHGKGQHPHITAKPWQHLSSEVGPSRCRDKNWLVANAGQLWFEPRSLSWFPTAVGDAVYGKVSRLEGRDQQHQISLGEVPFESQVPTPDSMLLW